MATADVVIKEGFKKTMQHIKSMVAVSALDLVSQVLNAWDKVTAAIAEEVYSNKYQIDPKKIQVASSVSQGDSFGVKVTFVKDQ